MPTKVHTLQDVVDEITISIERPGTSGGATKKIYNLSREKTIIDLKAEVARDFELPAEYIRFAFPGGAGPTTPKDLADSDSVMRIPDRTKLVVHDQRTAGAGQSGEKNSTQSQVPHKNYIENNNMNINETAAETGDESNKMAKKHKMVNTLVAPSDGRPHDNAIRDNTMNGGEMWNSAGDLASLKGDNPLFSALMGGNR